MKKEKNQKEYHKVKVTGFRLGQDVVDLIDAIRKFEERDRQIVVRRSVISYAESNGWTIQRNDEGEIVKATPPNS